MGNRKKANATADLASCVSPGTSTSERSPVPLAAGDPTSSPDRPQADWERSCRVLKVRQTEAFDCGVACAAMVSARSYGDVRKLFIEKRIGTRKKRPLATNFKELQYALQLLGIESAQKRWKWWDAIDGLGIVAVDSSYESGGGWHWVVAESHPAYGIVLHDPGFDLPSFSSAEPVGIKCHPFTEYQAQKSWIQVSL